MNNIVISNDCFKKIDSDTAFVIEKDTILTIYLTNKTINLSFIVNQNVNSYVNIFNIDSNCKIDIDISNNSTFYLSNSVINHNNVEIDLLINHNIKSNSNIVNHGININDGKMVFNVDAVVKKGMTSSNLKQDNKIINLANGNSTIRPNLLIDEFDSYASHSAYISKFNKEEIFYLLSRGISEKTSIYLLTKSFLLGKMKLSEDIESKFIDEISKI